MNSLTDVPPEALESILYFLPQRSLLALAQTNFHFYEPCLKRLYKKLVIQIDPVLRNDATWSSRQRLDHVELCVTTISGFKAVTVPKKAHLQMVLAKIRTLINSISVNPVLATYIELIEVADTFDAEVDAALRELFALLASTDNTIAKIYIADKTLRQKLGYHEWRANFGASLRSVTVDSLDQVPKLTLDAYPKLTELIIAGTGAATTLYASVIPLLERLEHLKIRDDPQVYDTVSAALWNLYRTQHFQLKNLKTFNVVHTHKNYTHGFPYLAFEKLENFQLSIGCDDPTSCKQECLEVSLSRFQFKVLKRLAILQNSPAHLNNHKNTEAWDLVVFDFVKSTIESCGSLFYLSIRHNVPEDGVIDDGYEGNYIRKVKLYTILLPGLLATIQRHVVNLVLPNFVASLACYEQPMNTFLWNGCKCPHCEVYLTKLDDYLLLHRYYTFAKGVYKDLQTVQVMRSMSEVLVDRVKYDSNVGDLYQLSRPMRNLTWNFHNNKFSIPFRCLAVKTYEIDEMEDEKVEKAGKVERFFDAEETENDCVFLRKEQFIPNYLVVISHFLNDIIRRMINLNRGDAEDVEIGREKDENDGYTQLQINKMLLNGIDYNFDHEINGTIFFTNSYDSTEYD